MAQELRDRRLELHNDITNPSHLMQRKSPQLPNAKDSLLTILPGDNHLGGII